MASESCPCCRKLVLSKQSFTFEKKCPRRFCQKASRCHFLSTITSLKAPPALRCVCVDGCLLQPFHLKRKISMFSFSGNLVSVWLLATFTCKWPHSWRALGGLSRSWFVVVAWFLIPLSALLLHSLFLGSCPNVGDVGFWPPFCHLGLIPLLQCGILWYPLAGVRYGGYSRFC